MLIWLVVAPRNDELLVAFCCSLKSSCSERGSSRQHAVPPVQPACFGTSTLLPLPMPASPMAALRFALPAAAHAPLSLIVGSKSWRSRRTCLMPFECR